MQLHLQAVRIYQVDAKARSGDMTSKHNVTLADQTGRKKKRKREKRKSAEMAHFKRTLDYSSSGCSSGSHM